MTVTNDDLVVTKSGLARGGGRRYNDHAGVKLMGVQPPPRPPGPHPAEPASVPLPKPSCPPRPGLGASLMSAVKGTPWRVPTHCEHPQIRPQGQLSVHQTKGGQEVSGPGLSAAIPWAQHHTTRSACPAPDPLGAPLPRSGETTMLPETQTQGEKPVCHTGSSLPRPARANPQNVPAHRLPWKRPRSMSSPLNKGDTVPEWGDGRGAEAPLCLHLQMGGGPEGNGATRAGLGQRKAPDPRSRRDPGERPSCPGRDHHAGPADSAPSLNRKGRK